MTFLQPWAWLGLVAVAAPILAHLLARRPARRLPFPIVRFLPASIQTPVTRHRLSDLAVLILRCSVIIAAVAALAQPVWISPARQRALGNELARAVITHEGHAGGAAIEARVSQLVTEAAAARSASSSQPALMLEAAATWLGTQPMRREIVIVSAFPAGALTREDIAKIPAEIGIRLERIAPASPVTPGLPLQDRESVILLAGAAEKAGAEAARTAALSTGAPARASDGRAIAVLFPGFETRATLLKTSRPIDQPWMFDAIAQIARDVMLDTAARRAGKRIADVVSWSAANVDGQDNLILSTPEPPHTVVSAALVAAAARAGASSPPVPPEGSFISADELRAWERSPAAVAAAAQHLSERDSLGRWFWLAALVLMAVEFVLVRRARPATQPEVTHAARVA